MPESVFTQNGLLRAHLGALLRRDGQVGELRLPEGFTGPIDVVVTLNEVNDRHGTGPLIKRILKGRRNILSIRSRDDWGHQDFGDWHLRISQKGRTRPECFGDVLRILAGRNVRSVLCVPFWSMKS